MKEQQLSEDQIRKMIKEELNEQIKEWNLSDDDIRVLNKQPTNEDIRQTGGAWETITKIGEIIVVGVKKGGRFVKLLSSA